MKLIAAAVSMLLLPASPSSLALGQSEVATDSDPEVEFDPTHVRSVKVYDVENAKSSQVLSAAMIDNRLVVSGKRYNGEDSRLWMTSLDASGQQQWFILLDTMRHNTDHLHSCGFFPYRYPFARPNPVIWSALLIRRGHDTSIRYVTKDGEIKLGRWERDVGQIEDTGGALWLSDEEIYAFGSGMLRPESINNAWVARMSAHGHLRWKTPVLFHELPSEVAGKERKPGEKRYGGSSVTGGIRVPDGTLLFTGAHRYSTSKFGTGPSDLFLLRMDAEGKEHNRHVINDRRICSSPGVAEVNGTFFLVSTPQGFSRAMKEGYDIKLTRFDSELNQVWEKDVQNSSNLSLGGTVLLNTGDDDAPLLIASPVQNKRSTVIRIGRYDLDGERMGQTDIHVNDAASTILRTGFIRGDDAIIIAEHSISGFLVIRMPVVSPESI